MSYIVVARISGGLGNQMFQYAAARRLAFKRRAPLKLDLSELEGDPQRRYALNHLSIRADIATYAETQDLARKKPFYRKKTYIRERRFTFEPRIRFKVPPVYLQGYWASEKYFFDVQSLIRKEFEISTAASLENEALLSQISQDANPVAVHVRRGDYVGHGLHASQPMEYYRAAAAGIHAAAPDAKFYVFSDDPVWTKENLKLPYEVAYVSHNGENTNYEDLRLMTFCRHFVIANSTFSWWGAWLSARKGKTVYAPRKWFNDPSYDTKDLIPPGWIQI